MNAPTTMRLVRLLLWPLGAFWIAYVASVVADAGNPWYYVASLVGVAAAFMGLGLLTWARRPANRVGPLLVAIGIAWLIPPLRYSSDSAPWTVALVLPTLHQALLVHLVFAYPTGRISSRLEQSVVGLVYVVAIAGPLAVAMTQRDPGSLGFAGAPRNLVLVSTDVELWRTIREWLSYIQDALAILILLAVVRRTVVATGPARRSFAPLLFGGIVAVLLFTTGYDILGYASPFLPVAVQDWRGLGRWVVVASYAFVPFAFSFGLLRARLAHSAVADLVADLGDSPSAQMLADGLVRALGDPSLRLIVWSEEERRFVDLQGEPVEPPAENAERAITILEQNGRRVGALVYDAALLSDPGLMDAASAVARLALEHERLEGELRAQLAEVQASRVRIVDAGTAERRQLERNLHDGAQQHLLRLSLLVQVARRGLRSTEDAGVAATLSEAAAAAKDALAEIRTLAHGLHPAILTEEGLAGAVEWLAEAAPLDVQITGTTKDRLPERVEVAAYFVVSEALANVTKHAHANEATISLARQDGWLMLDIVDDGVGGADPIGGVGLRGLADRVAALRGRFAAESMPGGGTRVHAEIPCE
jgi:signal transduction histidine kinase